MIDDFMFMPLALTCNVISMFDHALISVQYPINMNNRLAQLG